MAQNLRRPSNVPKTFMVGFARIMVHLQTDLISRRMRSGIIPSLPERNKACDRTIVMGSEDQMERRRRIDERVVSLEAIVRKQPN